MTDNIGVVLFSISLSAGILLPKAVACYKDAIGFKVDSQLSKISCISAPGKVLIAGGYLVLEHPNLGLSISTSSRFYTTVKLLCLSNAIEEPESRLKIVVKSPQFSSLYTYSYYPNSDNLLVEGPSNVFVEKSLAFALSFIKQFKTKEGVNFCDHIKTISASHYMDIVLRGDNDFYSQTEKLKQIGLPLSSESLAKLPSFIACHKADQSEKDKSKVSKTGLGSSSALTTSLVATLLQWFDVIRIGLRPDSEDRRIVHNLAQLVHGHAQNKIGSGFDVATAVYGSMMYRRFSSRIFESIAASSASATDSLISEEDRLAASAVVLSPESIYAAVMSQGQAAASIPASASVNALLDKRAMMMRRKSSSSSSTALQHSNSSSSGKGCSSSSLNMLATATAVGWSQTIRPFTLPPGIDIVLGDVNDGGSSTPNMARQVRKWKNENVSTAEPLWDSLAEANKGIFNSIEELNDLYKMNPLQFNKEIGWAAEQTLASIEQQQQTNSNDNVGVAVHCLLRLRTYFATARKLLKQIGDYAGVSIEPDSQTRIADITATLPGVLAAGVPGAGGLDAIFAIVLSDKARGRVESLWSHWEKEEEEQQQQKQNKESTTASSSICPLILRAGSGVASGITAHFGADSILE